MIKSSKECGCQLQGSFAEIICDFGNLAGAIQQLLFDEEAKGNITSDERSKIRWNLHNIMVSVIRTNNEEELRDSAAEAKTYMDSIMKLYYKEVVPTLEVNPGNYTPEQDEEMRQVLDKFSRVVDLTDKKNKGGYMQ